METPKTLCLFSNGLVCAFDGGGDQLSKLKLKGWMEVYFEYLESQGIDPTEIENIETIVNGRHVYAEPFKLDGFWKCKFVDF